MGGEDRSDKIGNRWYFFFFFFRYGRTPRRPSLRVELEKLGFRVEYNARLTVLQR